MTREEFARSLKKLKDVNENGQDIDAIVKKYEHRNVYFYNDGCIQFVFPPRRRGPPFSTKNMNNNYYVYILTNKYHTTFYIGVTNDLYRRIIEHKIKINEGFTNDYNVNHLVHYELFPLFL